MSSCHSRLVLRLQEVEEAQQAAAVEQRPADEQQTPGNLQSQVIGPILAHSLLPADPAAGTTPLNTA